MKIKDKMKRFFTMSRSADGFTLVELIVVIAILAILGGVAVPAYGGYVSKTNKTADITLASDIEQAMIMAHYTGTIQPGATVIVYYGKEAEAKNGAEDAMIAAFGDNYKDTLQLSYNGWEAGPAGDANLMQTVQNSNFKRDEMEGMLGQVQTVVDAFSDFMVGLQVDTNSHTYKYLQMAGYTDGTVTEGNKNAVGNAAVFGVSEQFSGMMSDADDKQSFKDAWAEGNFDDVEGLDAVSKMAAEYAFTLAWAKEADKLSGGGTYYADLLTKGVNEEGADNKTLITGNMAKVQEEIGAKMDSDDAFAAGIDQYLSSGSADDAEAFLAYMNGVTTSSDSILEGNDLNKADFFTDGNVLNYVDNYFDASAFLQDAPDGAMVFIYNGTESIFCAPDWAFN